MCADLSVTTASEAETMEFGARLARHLRSGDVVALDGDLGAGKTRLVAGISRGLGVTARVTSPTFTLVHEYTTATGGALYHVDVYRLANDPADAYNIGLDELLAEDGICVIEWASRIAALLPADHLQVQLDIESEDTRRLSLRAVGPRAQEILASLCANDATK